MHIKIYKPGQLKFKKMKTYLYPALLIILMSSCKVTSTLYPISENPGDFIFKKEVLGKWGDIKDSSLYFTADTATGSDGKLYTITSVEYNEQKKRTDTTRILARLINISTSYFLDCQVDMEKEFQAAKKEYGSWLIGRHFIININFTATDKIEICFPDQAELIKLIDQKKIVANYAVLKEEDYLLLDRPVILRKAVAASLKYPSLYKDKMVLKRLR